MNRILATIIFSPLLAAACADKPACAYKSLCDSQADAAATGLFEALDRCASRGVMLGHQDDLSYGVGWVDAGDGRSDVRDVTGDYPSLFGWDLGHLELDSLRNLDGVPFEAMRRNMLSVDRMGGVNALSWHPRNPLTGGDAWDVTSAEVVSSIISGGALHDRYMAWIDRLADFVLSLRRDDGSLAPVIFRPYHEMSGSWFWGGAELCSDDDYKVLWRETIDRLRSRGVHNIVVAYSMADYADERQFAARYPGDDYVDIVGFDIYQYGSADEFLSQMKTKSGIARAFADKHDKLWAICECGYEGIPQNDWFTAVLAEYACSTGCSHLLLWRNAHDREGHFYASYPGHASAEDMRRFASRDDVLMLSDFKRIVQSAER